MTKRTKLIIGVATLVLIVACATYFENRDRMSYNFTHVVKEKPIPESDWGVIASVAADDTTHVLMIELKEKYGGLAKKYCMAIFENKKTGQKKLVAPWIPGGILVERGNLFTTEPKLVLKSEME